MKDTHKSVVLKVSGQESIGFVAEGIESAETGYILSEDGLSRIAEALEAAELSANHTATQATELARLQQELQQATEAREAAETSLQEAQANLSTAQARITELENEAPITQTAREQDGGKTGVKFHDNPANSINRLADGFFGQPKTQTPD